MNSKTFRSISWEDSSLEALAEAIDIPTRNSEAKFAIIVRTAILDELLAISTGNLFELSSAPFNKGSVGNTGPTASIP